MSVVLVDTPVWRAFFAGKSQTLPLLGLLEANHVLNHVWVTGELLLGGLSTREAGILDTLPVASIAAPDHVLALIRQHHLARRGIGWVDANLLASAIVAHAMLWTLDHKLAAVAADLNIAA